MSSVTSHSPASSQPHNLNIVEEVFLVKTENFLIANKESTGLEDERVKWVQILWGTILSEIVKKI